MEEMPPRCPDGCISEARLTDWDSDGAQMRCGRCSNQVCLDCQTAPVEEHVVFCEACTLAMEQAGAFIKPQS